MSLSEAWGVSSQLSKQRPSLLLTLVRHGQSEGNRQGLIQGQSDYPLSELGVQQARALRQHTDHRRVTFDAVYSSDLLRARQTADIVAAGLDITDDSRLRTRRHGGLSRLVSAPPPPPLQAVVPVDGETRQQVRQRAADFFRDLCVRHMSERSPHVLVVTHNWFICELVHHLTEAYAAEVEKWDGYRTPNTGVTVVHVAGAGPDQLAITVLTVGSNEHLAGSPTT